MSAIGFGRIEPLFVAGEKRAFLSTVHSLVGTKQKIVEFVGDHSEIHRPFKGARQWL